MNSILAVTDRASDLNLLTVAELRAAAGVADNSKDASLVVLGERVSASIVAACNVRSSGVLPPTLRQETLSETFRIDLDIKQLILARMPVVEVVSISESGSLLDLDYDIETDAAAGMITRLSADTPQCWTCGKVVVAYKAGWSTVPADLKFAAVKFVQSVIQQGDRDPLLKSKTTEGVSSYEWWVDPTKDSIVPGEVMDLLVRGNYVNRTWCY